MSNFWGAYQFTRTYEDKYEVLTEILHVPMWGIILFLYCAGERCVLLFDVLIL